MNKPGIFCERLGLRVKLNQNLTVPGPLKTIPRSWGDRLFTRPWRPWLSTKIISTQIPDPKIYKIKIPALMMIDVTDLDSPASEPSFEPSRLEEILAAHPETWRKAEEALEQLSVYHKEWKI